jgi:hypothetical protein
MRDHGPPSRCTSIFDAGPLIVAGSGRVFPDHHRDESFGRRIDPCGFGGNIGRKIVPD